MKKIYECPDLEKSSLMVEENLMNLPTVSDGDYGWADGPDFDRE